MSVATGTAIAIGVGAGTSILGGVLSSKAAKHASEQQAQSAEQALALQREQYQQTRADLSPYRTQGGQGLTALTALLGLPAAPSGAAPNPNQQGMANLAQGLGGVGARLVPGGTLQRPGTAPPAPTTGGTMYGAAPGAPGGPVLLRAPNGQTQAVPADQVDFYLARGATRG